MSLIVVIDDDPNLRRLLVRTLMRAGHEVLEAESGFRGLCLNAARKPELVIANVLMPAMDCIETIGILRRERPSLPILAFSAGGHEQRNFKLLRLARQRGASATLGRPILMEDLLKRVDALVQDAAAPKEHGAETLDELSSINAALEPRHYSQGFDLTGDLKRELRRTRVTDAPRQSGNKPNDEQELLSSANAERRIVPRIQLRRDLS
jgi:DNA-binding response OmpR family regulator